MEDFEEMPESERALAREVSFAHPCIKRQVNTKLIVLSREGRHKTGLLKRPLGGAKVRLKPW